MPPPVATLRPLPSHPTGLPRLPEPPFRRAVPTTPADRTGAHVDYFPACAAFPKWQEGRHPHCHFRGLHRLHSVTARRIAQPPKAIFVTRLQPCQLPSRAARQLPDQSTTLRVESSSTDDPRLRGALPNCDIGAYSDRGRWCSLGLSRQRDMPRLHGLVQRRRPCVQLAINQKSTDLGS